MHYKEVLVRVPALVLIGLIALSASPRAGQTPRNSGAPETFSANAQVKGAAGAIAATILIDIQRYTPDFDRSAVESALKGGGYPEFLTALRKAPRSDRSPSATRSFRFAGPASRRPPKGGRSCGDR